MKYIECLIESPHNSDQLRTLHNVTGLIKSQGLKLKNSPLR